MKILAIRFARLGDVILLLPALACLKERFPDSDLTLLTGHRCAPIAELCPAIDHVIAVDRLAMRDGPMLGALRGMFGLLRDIRKNRFDLVIDFHSFRETNLLTWLSGASERIGMKRYKAPFLKFCFNRPPIEEDKSLHVAAMFRKVAGCVEPSEELPVLSKISVRKAEQPTLALYIDAPVPERIWPPERFAEVADFAIEKQGAVVTVLCSPKGSGLAARLKDSSRHAGKISISTNLPLAELVSAIGSAALLVSNDTGPMHIGPAVGVPTLGLFSVGYPEHFKPIGINDRFLRANPIEEIETRDVIRVVEEMWTIPSGQGPRH